MQDKFLYEVRDISYQYSKEITALKNVVLRVQEGEMIGVLGANGSGKSTLLNILGGLTFPYEGEVRFRGEVLSEDKLKEKEFRFCFRKAVGMLFQNPDVQLFTDSVWDEVAFGPLQLGFEKEEVCEIVENILREFNLLKVRNRAPHTLSGGEKKVVAMASILSVDPLVLLLDEPTGGLDPKNSAKVIDMVIDLNKKGRTVISATNDMIAAPEISDRVVVLGEDHSVIASGAIEEIMADESLLVHANLIHTHQHRHKRETHKHSQTHLRPSHHPEL